MEEKIKNKAQEIYPVCEKPECFTAFLQGATLGKKETIESAIKWLDENYLNAYEGTWNQIKEQFLRDFKEAMEK